MSYDYAVTVRLLERGTDEEAAVARIRTNNPLDKDHLRQKVNARNHPSLKYGWTMDIEEE